MTTFCIAYKNKFTTAWAEKTGHAAGGWVRLSSFESFSEAKRIFDIRKEQMPNSAIGMFANHENDTTAWFERKPSYLANRHVLFDESSVRAVFGNLINSLESDWF